MRLLLDENMSRIERELTAAGIPTDHIDTLKLKGIGDWRVFQVARERGYDAIVTKDHYRQPAARRASLRAMVQGLRIVRLTFSPDGPVSDRDASQLALIVARRGEIEQVIKPDSATRLLVLNANVDAVTREQTLDEVAAELRRREQPRGGRTANR